MKLGWTSYFLVIAAAMPIVLSSPASAGVAADGRALDPSAYVGATGTTGSSNPPPLPTCGALVQTQIFGPIDVAEYLDFLCKEDDETKPYRMQACRKTKRIYEHGYVWECARYYYDDAACSSYLTTTCPDPTCHN